MKHFTVMGFKDGGLVFAFPLRALNSYYALRYASQDNLVAEREFDRLFIEEVEE